MPKSLKPERSAYHTAIDLLARREHSRRELQTKLCAKRFPADEVDEVLDQLASAGLQSDQRFAEAYIESRVGRGMGPARILYEVKQHVSDEQLVANVLNELDINWHEVASRAYSKKYGEEDCVDVKEKARRIRFMQSRGFSNDIIRRLIS